MKINISRSVNTQKSKQVKIKYTKSILSYLDILGFENLVKNEKDVTNLYETLKQVYFQTLLINPLFDDIEKKEIGVFSFSDLVIRVINLEKYKANDLVNFILGHEIIVLGLVQSRLLCNFNILLRGVVVYDDIFFNNKENIIVGPALISAYHFERKTSIFPRIIIDPRVVALKRDSFEKSPSQLEGKIGDYRYDDIITRGLIYLGTKNDFDGIYFIDYLQISYMFDCNSPNNNSDWIEILKKHKNLIQYFLKTYDIYSDNSNNIDVYQKVNWMKIYHNFKVQQMMKNPLEKGTKHFQEYHNLIIS